jgi:hypothetical protein
VVLKKRMPFHAYKKGRNLREKQMSLIVQFTTQQRSIPREALSFSPRAQLPITLATCEAAWPPTTSARRGRATDGDGAPCDGRAS